MGYKLAGYDVLGGCDIDPEMGGHYKRNLHPNLFYECPVSDLLNQSLPDELHHLDILDGSPPCSTFSMMGKREEVWGKLKHFREGQAEQVLSDLFFDYLALVDKLKPRVAIAENVRGLIQGRAKGYVKLIFDRFREIGYRPQLFLINAADCGVPQSRERVFFVAIREDIDAPMLILQPAIKRVSVAEATSDLLDMSAEEFTFTRPQPEALRLWPLCSPGKNFAAVHKDLGEKETSFSRVRLASDRPSNTLTAGSGSDVYHWAQCRKLTVRELIRLGSFPDDYTFSKSSLAGYLIGMSVPPRMMEYVASEVAIQWLLK